jgi:hypothetical protein
MGKRVGIKSQSVIVFTELTNGTLQLRSIGDSGLDDGVSVLMSDSALEVLRLTLEKNEDFECAVTSKSAAS